MYMNDRHSLPAYNYRTKPERLNKIREIAELLDCPVNRVIDHALDSWLESVSSATGEFAERIELESKV